MSVVDPIPDERGWVFHERSPLTRGRSVSTRPTGAAPWCPRGDVESQPLDTIKLGEIAIEGTKWQVTGFPCDLQDQAVRKTQRRPSSEAFDSGRHCVGILKRHMLVIEEHLDGRCDLLRIAIVDRGQDPSGFGEYEMRCPGATRHERLSRCNLLGVIPRDQPDQDVRINGSHAAS